MVPHYEQHGHLVFYRTLQPPINKKFIIFLFFFNISTSLYIIRQKSARKHIGFRQRFQGRVSIVYKVHVIGEIKKIENEK